MRVQATVRAERGKPDLVLMPAQDCDLANLLTARIRSELPVGGAVRSRQETRHKKSEPRQRQGSDFLQTTRQLFPRPRRVWCGPYRHRQRSCCRSACGQPPCSCPSPLRARFRNQPARGSRSPQFRVRRPLQTRASPSRLLSSGSYGLITSSNKSRSWNQKNID